MNTPNLFVALVVTVSCAYTPTISAHHSRTFFADEVNEVEGELQDLQWRNPHIVFTVKTDEGASWKMESASIYMLQRMGVESDLLADGIRVRVAGRASTRRDNEMLASNVLLPAGEELLLFTGTKARWSGELVGGGDQWAIDSADVAAIQAENLGIFRVWSIQDNRGRVQNFPFTEAALAAKKDWDPLDNYIMRCEQPGMPRPMLNPHPFEFIDDGDTIMLHGEEMDIVRTIHVADAVDPASQPASPLGYSVGRWEDNTLVVETNRINWPWFDSEGIPQSEDVHVEERFTLSEDQARIDYLLTVTDPTTFTKPATSQRHWLALGEQVEPYDCAVY
jgi:hypothetical protein